jgi:arginine/ornithine N-succinyltransferase beta subunit
VYVIRDVQRADLPGLKKLGALLDTINLPDDEKSLLEVIDHSVRSFDARIRDPFKREYLFVLEDIESEKVIGSSLIIAQHGTRDAPHVFLDVSEKEHYSHNVDKHFKHRSPLWEALGRKFTGLSYQEADRLSRENKEFIQQLFPPGEIYATLFTQKVQEAIGVVGPESEGARSMLEQIGFKYDERIDPFDGGPHWTANTSQIEPIRRYRRAKLSAELLPQGAELESKKIEDVLVALERSTGRNRFRAVRSLARFADNAVILPKDAREALGARTGDRLHTIPFES